MSRKGPCFCDDIGFGYTLASSFSASNGTVLNKNIRWLNRRSTKGTTETGRNVPKEMEGAQQKVSYVLLQIRKQSRASDRAHHLQNPLVARSSFRVITSCLGEFQSPAGSLASARARHPHPIPLHTSVARANLHTEN